VNSRTVIPLNRTESSLQGNMICRSILIGVGVAASDDYRGMAAAITLKENRGVSGCVAIRMNSCLIFSDILKLLIL
jgi:hypothetical protein